MSRSIRTSSIVVACLVASVWIWSRFARTPTREDTVVAEPHAMDSSLAPVAGVESSSSSTSRRSGAEPDLQSTPQGSASSIEVRVVDSAGDPLPGATIHAFDDAAPIDLVADSAGRARIDSSLASRGYVHLLVRSPGLPHVNGHFAIDRAVEVRIPSPAVLRGRVLDAASGTPLAAALVLHAHHDGSGCPTDTIRCAADGTFELPMLPAGDAVRLSVGLAGGPYETFRFRLEAGQDAIERDFRLGPGVEVHGVVVDILEGSPVPDVAILGADPGIELARTDEAGRFRCRIVPQENSGLYLLRARRPGHCPLQKRWTPNAFDGSKPIRVPFSRSSPIEGEVRDPAGRAVAGLELWIGPDPRIRSEEALAAWRDRLDGWVEDRGDGLDTTKTDGEGRFAAAATPPWVERFIVCALPFDSGLLAHHGARQVAPGETTRLELVTRPQPAGARIRGRLLLNGQPVAGAVQWQGATRRGRAEVSAAGYFTLDLVEPGEIQVSTERRPPSLPYAQLASKHSMRIAADESIERDFDLVVPMESISGRVTSTRGTPIEGLDLRVQSLAPAAREGLLAAAKTDAQGRWRVEVRKDLEPYEVRLTGPGIQIDRETPAGRDDVDLVVPAIARVRVRVRDARTEQWVKDVRFSWCPTGTSDFREVGRENGLMQLVPTADGWYEIELPEGTIDLAATSPDPGHLRGLVEGLAIEAGTDVRTEIALERGLSVSVELASGENPPRGGTLWVWLVEPADLAAASNHARVAEARLEGVGIDEIGEVRPKVDDFERTLGGRPQPKAFHLAAGRPVRLEGVAPGRYVLLAPADSVTVEPESIDLQEDGATIQIRWKPYR